MPLRITCSKCGGVIYSGDLADPHDILAQKDNRGPVCGRRFTDEEKARMIDSLKISINYNYVKPENTKHQKWLSRVEKEQQRRNSLKRRYPEAFRELIG